MHADDPLHAEIRSRLNALIEAPPVPRRSILETTLEPHRELITQAHAQGHNYRSIADALRSAGLKASPETIRRYVQRVTKTPSTPRAKVKTRRAQPKLEPISDSTPKKQFGLRDL